jgi:hypothetical protein
MNTPWKLFLDDYRTATKVSPYYADFITARSYDEAVKLVEERGAPIFVAFDHDLADEHYEHTIEYKSDSEIPTGMDFARYLVNRDMDERGKFLHDDFRFAVHSMNPAGAENIQKFMDSWLEYKKEEFTHL